MNESSTTQFRLQAARNEGIQQGLVMVARNMLEEGMAVPQIVRLTGLSEHQIHNLEDVPNIRLTEPDPALDVEMHDPMLDSEICDSTISVSPNDPLVDFIGAVSHGSLTQQLDVELYGA